jgi:hypothetical protein
MVARMRLDEAGDGRRVKSLLAAPVGASRYTAAVLVFVL